MVAQICAENPIRKFKILKRCKLASSPHPFGAVRGLQLAVCPSRVDGWCTPRRTHYQTRGLRSVQRGHDRLEALLQELHALEHGFRAGLLARAALHLGALRA